ncbi:hypothetical protein [Aeoliella sp.]|uniref:hypothetical protein n=1 Tax=Aeoliella sp. TaxID=2795800 RepID=UPI003CCC2DE0
MRLSEHIGPRGTVNGYTLCLSAAETARWGDAWPCSTLAGSRLTVAVDRNGLFDLLVNGRSANVDGHELDAIVADHLTGPYRHLWPCWEAPK